MTDLDKAQEAYANIKSLFSIAGKAPTAQEVQACLDAVTEGEDEHTKVCIIRRLVEIVENDPQPFQRVVAEDLRLPVHYPDLPTDQLFLFLERTVDEDGDFDGFAVGGLRNGKKLYTYKRGRVFICQGWGLDAKTLLRFLNEAPPLLWDLP